MRNALEDNGSIILMEPVLPQAEHIEKLHVIEEQ